MPHFYRHPNPAATSVSIDGREHSVNSDGFIEIADKDMSANLHQELTTNIGAEQHFPDEGGGRPQPPGSQMSDEDVERATLFSRLDTITGRKIDRRRSLKQLQEMLAQHERQQQATVGASRTPINDPAAKAADPAQGGAPPA